MKPRILAALLAAPLAFAPAASADPTIPGCYGTGSGVMCEVSPRVSTGENSSTPTPVCVYTCVTVGVPRVSPYNGVYQVCLDYTSPSGTPGSRCYVDVDMEQTWGNVAELVCRYRPTCAGGRTPPADTTKPRPPSQPGLRRGAG